MLHTFENVSRTILNDLKHECEMSGIENSGYNHTPLISKTKRNFVLENKKNMPRRALSEQRRIKIPEVYRSSFTKQKFQIRKKFRKSSTTAKKKINLPRLSSISGGEWRNSFHSTSQEAFLKKKGNRKLKDIIKECDKYTNSMPDDLKEENAKEKASFNCKFFERMEAKKEEANKNSIDLLKEVLRKEVREIYLKKKYMNQGWDKISKKKPSKFVISKMLEHPFLDIDESGDVVMKTSVNI